MKNLTKPSRPQHFQLVIKMPTDDDFTEKIRELNFITQARLENLLLDFKFRSHRSLPFLY